MTSRLLTTIKHREAMMKRRSYSFRRDVIGDGLRLMFFGGIIIATFAILITNWEAETEKIRLFWEAMKVILGG